MAVNITVNPNEVSVKSPYSAEFIMGAQSLGGGFSNGAWHFATRHEELVRKLCFKVYGTDGSAQPMVTINCKLDYISFYGEFTIGGIQVLKKWDRDQVPKVSVGCAVIQGRLKNHGGSRKNPRIEHEDNTIVEVTNVPLILAQRLVKNEPEAYQIVEQPNSKITTAEQKLIDALLALSEKRQAIVLAAIRN